jgi:hypothetical protein
MLLKDAKKSNLIEKGDIKEINGEFKSFKTDSKKQEKEFKHDIKELQK